MHQLPPRPAYLRVKTWRRLQQLGAVAIKSSVYVLPWTDQSQEDFQWTLRAIVAGGGEASICAAHFVDGLTDAQIEALFNGARDADYARVSGLARALASRASRRGLAGKPRATLAAEVERLRGRTSEIARIDFFGAPGRVGAEGLLSSLERRLLPGPEPPLPEAPAALRREDHQGRTWSTRKGIHVDRMASGWLIRRFIDAKPRFRFVDGKDRRPVPGELRFDMSEAEFTHVGDRCTFEVLLERFGIEDAALGVIAEIVHDIDLKDEKFGRPETPGIASLVAGIARCHDDDGERLARASSVLDDLHGHLTRRHAGGRRTAAMPSRPTAPERRASPSRPRGSTPR
ncbi:MAG: chromate resistance protein [Acidobacteriota bacterium]